MRSGSAKFSVLILLSGCWATMTFAQTPLSLQAVVKADPCSSADVADLGSCGMEAFGDKDYPAARKAWTLAAQHGDYEAAKWLGEMFVEGKGAKQDYVQAYQWFDIAAALHARGIAREGPASDPAARDSNQSEIDPRNAVAKKMKAEQIKQAQQLSHDWQKANPHAVVEELGFAY
jgi:TPR repeat protein